MKSITIVLNLILGNSILWFFEVYGRKQDHLDYRFMLGFSIAALVLLLAGFRMIRPKQSWPRSIVLAAVISFLVPVVGLLFSFLDITSLNSTAVGAMVAVILGPMTWEWAVPMFVLNSILFHRLARI